MVSFEILPLVINHCNSTHTKKFIFMTFRNCFKFRFARQEQIKTNSAQE